MEVLDYCRAHPGIRPDHFEILATDISPSALFLAKGGRYNDAAMGRGMPPGVRERHFTEKDGIWSVSDEVKKLVTLRKFNLQDNMDPLGRFDIVFCRYVTIYFAADFKKKVYEGFARLLSPDGHLVISAVESLLNVTSAFDALSHAGGTYYRCRA